MVTRVLSASDFNSTYLNATASTSAQLLQQTKVNQLNATAKTAINAGTLTTNQTQLTINGAITQGNAFDYYTFNLEGTSLKASFTNTTDSTDLRYQVYDTKGNIVADSQGTASQQTAFSSLTSPGGLSAKAGQYTVKVLYAPDAQKNLQQNYQLKFYSGTRFDTSYETTAQTQVKASQIIPVDETNTWATANASLNTVTQNNRIPTNNQASDQAANAVNVGWLSENKTALKIISQLTTADHTDYYSFSFQKGSAIKLDLNNTTALVKQTGLQVQLYDSTGTYLLADSSGTADQKKAYSQLTSSTGLKASSGTYLVRISYAAGASRSNTQNYNFRLSSGTYYSELDQTTAGAQSIKSALLNGTYTSGYSPATALASYFTSNTTDNLISSLASIPIAKSTLV